MSREQAIRKGQGTLPPRKADARAPCAPQYRKYAAKPQEKALFRARKLFPKSAIDPTLLAEEIGLVLPSPPEDFSASFSDCGYVQWSMDVRARTRDGPGDAGRASHARQLWRDSSSRSDHLDAEPAWPGISSHCVSARLDAGRRTGFSCGPGVFV